MNESFGQYLSIVIITRNRSSEIVLSIKSCIEHTRRFFELLVIDNASTDNTECVVKKFCDDNSIRLKYIRLLENTGVSHARNIGYKEASGDIVFFIDDDAVIESDNYSLDYVADYLRKSNSVFSATGRSNDYRYGGDLKFVKFKSDAQVGDEYIVRSYVGFNHFIKKGFSEDPFLYPDNLFYGSEELYVGLNILKNNKRTVYINSHFVQHNPSNNTRINRRDGLLNGYINTYVIKHYFLVGVYAFFSYIFFLFRLLKFCKLNIKEIRKCLKESKIRYEKKYENKMTIKQIRFYIKHFGIFSIL